MPRRRSRLSFRARAKRPKAKKKITWSAIRKHNRGRKRSGLELTVHEWLKESNISFQKEKAIGRCHVDVFIKPRTVIELNGCYWHGCMICNPKLSETQKIAQIKDARRYAFLRNRGFDVVVIWECEVDKEPDRVKSMLKAIANAE